MVDLKLALTAARVDQQHVATLLKTWNIGQTLQALVTDKGPSGQLLLRMGGAQFTATTDTPVQKGTFLKLEITSLSPTVTLKIIPTTTDSLPPAAQELKGQLQLLLPRQGNVTTPLSALLDPSLTANILALLGGRGDAIRALTRHRNQFERLADPKQLRAAVSHSGLFLEARLLSLLLGEGTSLPPDLKADLFRLRQQLDQAMAQPGKSSAGANNAALQAFSKQLDGALSTITLNQLSSRGVDDVGRSAWLVHLPLQMSEPDQRVSISIARDHKNRSPDPASDDEWHVVVDLSLPTLGAIEAEIFLRGERISLAMYCERQTTSQLMEQRASELRYALESQGMEVAVLANHQGSRSETPQSQPIQSCLDERA